MMWGFKYTAIHDTGNNFDRIQISYNPPKSNFTIILKIKYQIIFDCTWKHFIIPNFSFFFFLFIFMARTCFHRSNLDNICFVEEHWGQKTRFKWGNSIHPLLRSPIHVAPGGKSAPAKTDTISESSCAEREAVAKVVTPAAFESCVIRSFLAW